MRGFIFDYGGTIDTNGIHWAEVLRHAYEVSGFQVDNDLFRHAYVHGERTLALNPIIQNTFTFKQTLEAKVAIQLQYIAEQQQRTIDELNRLYSANIVSWCDDFVKKTIGDTGKVLEQLSRKFPLVLVSNFYGNIHSVLEDYGIDHYFCGIVESAVVGVRKPDPAIFRLGVEKLGFSPGEIVVVGDSLSKDIVPAKQTGCHTVWLKGPGWDHSGDIQCADETITDLSELVSLCN